MTLIPRPNGAGITSSCGIRHPYHKKPLGEIELVVYTLARLRMPGRHLAEPGFLLPDLPSEKVWSVTFKTRRDARAMRGLFAK